MPSWDLHNKWAKRMGIPLLISKEVNKIIDSLFEHDFGRNIKNLYVVAHLLGETEKIAYMLNLQK